MEKMQESDGQVQYATVTHFLQDLHGKICPAISVCRAFINSFTEIEMEVPRISF